MHRICKTKNEKGFTLIELMIVVAIIGILAAVAIPQFLDMMKSSKRNEAEVNLDAIRKKEKADWAERAGFIPGVIGATPGTPCCDSGERDRKCLPVATDWDDPVWQDLDFRLNDKHYFQYSYTGDATTGFTATATGDLDCDGTPVNYVLAGTRDGNGNPLFELTKPAHAD